MSDQTSPIPAPQQPEPGGAHSTGSATASPTPDVTMVPVDPLGPTLVRKISAEALGTFVLVLFGCGSVLASFSFGGPGRFSTPDYVAIALAFGLSVVAMAYAFGNISGGHFNPGVSLGQAIAGRMGWSDCGAYIGAQFAGGLLASLVLFIVSKTYDIDGAMAGVTPTWNTDPGAAWLGAFLLELIGMFVFVTIVLAVTDLRRLEERIPAPIAIGLGLTLVHLLLIGLTGAGVNPARSLTPALFGGWGDALQFQWLYLITGFGGAALAGFVYPLLFGYDRERAPRAPKPPKAPKTPKTPQQPGQPGAGQPYAGQPYAGQQWGQQPQQPGQPAPYGDPSAGPQQGGYPPQQAPGYGQPQGPSAYGQAPGQPQWQAPQSGEWQQPEASGPAQPWFEPDDAERTQIRPPEGQ